MYFHDLKKRRKLLLHLQTHQLMCVRHIWHINRIPLGDMRVDAKQHAPRRHTGAFLCKWWHRAAVITSTLSWIYACSTCLIVCRCVFFLPQISLFHYATFSAQNENSHSLLSVMLSPKGSGGLYDRFIVLYLSCIICFRCHLCCIFCVYNFIYCFALFQEPGTWTPSKPFDQGRCESLECCWLCDTTTTTKKHKENS